ncbi:MAG: 2-oxo acid dehydrogenase subunit E2 [Bdellovibrionales bacterium]|nr:2-oxo acid dehydrogenase subunit E2 [Bdellovibrionales bacterium]
MRVDMVMPQMGESIAEATILRWLKQPGEAVEKDEIILEISTDKVDSEIPAPAAGILSETLFQEGDVVPVKEKIAVIDTDASAGQASAPQSTAKSTPVAEVVEAEPVEAAPAYSNGSAAKSHASEELTSDRFYSPLVKSLAQQYGVSLSELDSIVGTGHGGRLTKQDFLNHVENRQRNTSPAPQQAVPQQQSYTAPPSAPASTQAPQRFEVKTQSTRQEMPSLEWQADGTKIVPLDNMRQAIAEHMVRSKHTSPHVYSVTEVDMSKIVKWRSKYKGEFESKEGFNLSFTPFFLEAAVKGLLEFPNINASLDGNKLILKKHINLGCAVALGTTGLIVPVIKKAEEKNIVGLARSLNDLALRARSKKLLPDDVQGGTFTVTNPGVFGTIIGYPIINQPQLAILSLGAITKRPVVINDAIAIRDVCNISLAYDHRVVDGALGGSYLKFVRDYLQNWDSNRSLY